MASRRTLSSLVTIAVDGLYKEKFILLTLLGLYIFYQFVQRVIFTYRIRTRYTGLPQLPRHVIWGNVVNAGTKLDPTLPRHPDYGFEEIWEELGRPAAFLMDLAPIDRGFIIINDPEVAEAVTSPSPEYKYSVPKSDTYKHNKALIGRESLVTREGETWRNLRRRFSPGFQPKYLNSLAPKVVANTRTFIQRLQSAARTGDSIPLADYAKDLTTEIILDLAVGVDLQSQTTAEGQGEKSYFGVLRASRRLSQLGFPTGRGLNPLVFLDPIRPTKEWFYEKMFSHKIKGWVRADLKAMQQQIKKPAEHDRSITQLAMAGLPPTAQLVNNTVDQIKTFLFAGQDTTSTLIAWMVYYLSKASTSPHYASIRRRLQAEHDQVFGSKSVWSGLDLLSHTDTTSSGNSPSAESILNTRLPYTMAFVKEILRLHPPAGTARLIPSSPPYMVSIPDHNSPDSGTEGSSGAMHDISGLRVYICQHVLHRNPKVWGADARVFRPERWLDEDYMRSIKTGSWRPFERGPRNCIGQDLALMEGKVVLVGLARGLGFEKVGYTSSQQVRMVDGMPEVAGLTTVGTGKVGEKQRIGMDLKQTDEEVWSSFAVTSVPVDGMRVRVFLEETENKIEKED